MLSSGLNLFVVALTVLNTVAAVWLLVWMRKRRGESQRTEDTTGHVWDEDLREYNNPLPRWWLWLFVLSVLFAIAYAVLYPTLGNSRGALGWT
jgi:cytochrome c oxidase cbb3-type subunit 3